MEGFGSMDQKKKKTFLIIGALVIAVAVAILSGLSSMTRREYKWDAKPAETPETVFVREMVEKAQGDPSRLTPEERMRMDAITHGYTEQVIRHGPLKKDTQ